MISVKLNFRNEISALKISPILYSFSVGGKIKIGTTVAV